MPKPASAWSPLFVVRKPLTPLSSLRDGSGGVGSACPGRRGAQRVPVGGRPDRVSRHRSQGRPARGFTRTGLSSYGSGHESRRGVAAPTRGCRQGSLAFRKLEDKPLGSLCFPGVRDRVRVVLRRPEQPAVPAPGSSSVFRASHHRVLITSHHCDTGCPVSLFAIQKTPLIICWACE